MTVDRLVSKNLLERVEPDSEAAHALVEEAQRHLASAVKIAGGDPNGAYQLLYDAARKAIAGHMLAGGFRVRKGRPGGHETTGRYARASIRGADEALAQFDRMRRNRNRSEYEIRVVGKAEIHADLAYAREIVAAVERELR